MQKQWFALVDCNSFYASCEQAFVPSLQGQPVVVLSNNDGCVIARSQKAKELGIPMGIPYWEVKKLIKKQGVKVFSSNYPLYGSMSNRVMSILHKSAPEVEVYSIDEAFLKLAFWDDSATFALDYGKALREKILRWVHLPTCVGIGPTKTLCKLANHIAKKRMAEGVYVLEASDPILKEIPVRKIWGVARGYEARLAKAGVKTAAELQQLSETWMQQEFGVVGVRLLKEMRGEPCYTLEPPVSSRKNVMVSRSFRRDVYQKAELAEAISVYITRLAEKLRHYQQVAGYITVFLSANPFRNVRKDGKRYFSQGGLLPFATANTNELIEFCLPILEHLYEQGTNYKKAGVLASNLKPESSLQTHLFLRHEKVLRNKALMQAIDQINRKMGRNTLFFASCGTHHTWSRKEQWRSPRYTTRWEELLEVYD
jgi:DNA polymerase V